MNTQMEMLMKHYPGQPLREDLSTQHAAVTDAHNRLADALVTAYDESKSLAKMHRRLASSRFHKGARAALSMDRWHTARLEVERAEEALDLAHLDLRSAAGEDV